MTSAVAYSAHEINENYKRFCREYGWDALKYLRIVQHARRKVNPNRSFGCIPIYEMENIG